MSRITGFFGRASTLTDPSQVFDQVPNQLLAQSRNLSGVPAISNITQATGRIRSVDSVARPARYEVLLFPPTGSETNPAGTELTDANGARDTSMKCENIAFPGRNIDTTPDTNIYGPTREIATGFSFGEVSGRFQMSSDMREKLFIEAWQKQSFNAQTWSMGYYSDYTGSMEIYQLDMQDKRTYGVKLWECFPKAIAQQALDYATTDQQQKLDVTFSYRYWTNLVTEAKLPKPTINITEDLRKNPEAVVKQFKGAVPAAKKLASFL